MDIRNNILDTLLAIAVAVYPIVCFIIYQAMISDGIAPRIFLVSMYIAISIATIFILNDLLDSVNTNKEDQQ